MTVFIALVTSRTTATVDSIRPIALHLVWFVDKTVCTEEVGPFLFFLTWFKVYSIQIIAKTHYQ